MKHWTNGLVLVGASIGFGALTAFAVAGQQSNGTEIAGASISLIDLAQNLLPDPTDPKGAAKQKLSMVSLGAGGLAAIALFVLMREVSK